MTDSNLSSVQQLVINFVRETQERMDELVNKIQAEMVEENEKRMKKEYQVEELVTNSTAEIAAVYLIEENDQSNTSKGMVTKIIEKQNADGSWTYDRKLIIDVGSNPKKVKKKQPDNLSLKGWMTTFIHSVYATKASGRELEWSISDEKAKRFIVNCVKESPIVPKNRKGNSSSTPKDISAMIEHLVNKAVQVLNEQNNRKCIIDVHAVNEAEIKENTRKTTREIHFVIDESGSMTGDKMEDAKRCLKALISGLEKQSTFQIYGFGTTFHRFFENGPQPYDDKSRHDRLDFIDKMDAKLGTTNLLGPLQEIYKSTLRQNVIRLLFVITDGCVDDLDVVVNLVRTNKMHNYIFSVGIGEDVCEILVRNIAEESSGKFVFVRESKGLLSNMNNLLKLALEIDE